MRRIALVVALAGLGGLALRTLAPKLHERIMAACERMFERMPDELPPKRMLRGIEEIRANTGRTLELLEQRERERAGGGEALPEASSPAR